MEWKALTENHELVVQLFKIMYALKMISWPQFSTDFNEITSIRTGILSSID